jgi:hypothetical protein
VKTLRENAEAILNRRQPDFYGDFMDALEFAIDAVFLSDMFPSDGEEHLDSWGVSYVWPTGAPGPHPIARPETIVIKDIERWEEQLRVPSLDDLDWSEAIAAASAIDRREKYVACFSPGGLFERSHHLMGFQNALENYLLYPDEVFALLQRIRDYKIEYLRLIGRHIQPDVVFFHDDWGMKTNLFLPPDIWRRMIKPLHAQIVEAAHQEGIFFLHHADCYCQPIVADMVEMGIDAWQGVVAQNDIVEIQRVTQGRLAMVGGIDGPMIDTDATTEEQIRAEVRRAIDAYCPAGRFFPSIPNGVLFDEARNAIYRDELASYGRKWAEEHPIGA